MIKISYLKKLEIPWITLYYLNEQIYLLAKYSLVSNLSTISYKNLEILYTHQKRRF